MTLNEIPIRLEAFKTGSTEAKVLAQVLATRAEAVEMLANERYMDALERIVTAMRELREFPDYDNIEFRALLLSLLFDLAELHFYLKDFKQSEKEVDVIFRLLDLLNEEDKERFAPHHIEAMALSTRILRSRKKALELLIKRQMKVEEISEKVNSGITAATDKLIEALHGVGMLLASSGDYRAGMKFLAEAIKLSKKRTGKVTRKEIKMTIEMAEIMMRVGSMRPRARRLLNAVLPHAIAQETIELEEDILALIEIIDAREENHSRWKTFMHRLGKATKERFTRKKKEDAEGEEDPAEETDPKTGEND